ncbi:DNA methyltransferase [Natrinema sp. CBA1119]|uniref:DNA methyltransferase n=1 Tax=Natrinema sp. CBA1119 TaxID=1608465 RepID=UPI00159BE041|nr:DNA methyltransferase [Natrinema sp. CBA1119]
MSEKQSPMASHSDGYSTTYPGDRNLAEINFEFANCDTSYLTHGLHNYPARMPPQIPKFFFGHYLGTDDIQPGDTVWDPFGGSGTTALEAQLLNLRATVSDINPLACMITRAKTTPIDIECYREAWRVFARGRLPEFSNTITEAFQQIDESYTAGDDMAALRPEVSERFEWFPKPQLYQLRHLRQRIDAVETAYGETIARFFRIALSITAREVSYQRTGEYKRYRIPEEARTEHDPDVFRIFTRELRSNLQQMDRYISAIPNPEPVVVSHGDSRTATHIPTNSADIVLTSPPYGDHDTTVAYGQYSLDPAVISMKVSRAMMKEVDKMGLGGRNNQGDRLRSLATRSEKLGDILDVLRSQNGRSGDTLSFFNDYFDVIKQVKRVLRGGQPAVFVVANRTVSDVQIPLDQITMELLENVGFEPQMILSRSLPYKTLPYANSPRNVAGQTGSMMSNENIVIARSPN